MFPESATRCVASRGLALCALRATAISLILLSTSAAHHSRANFDLDTVVEYTGVVTRFEWTNPHTAIYVQTTTPSGETIELEVEGNSIPTMIRRGWSRDSLRPGDRVVVRGNPDVDPDRYFLYFSSVAKDGTVIGDRPAPSNRLSEATGSTDFTGVWAPTGSFGSSSGGGDGGRAILLASPTPRNLPVTPKGAASYASFDPEDDPRNDCIPESLPAAISTLPYLWEIRKEPNGDYLFVHENYATPRVIHMNLETPPSGTQRSHDGYSIGRIENGRLVIETALFTPEPWGNDTGLDSGEQKRIVERYELIDGGKRLRVTYTQEDFEYLAEPVTRQLEWTHAAATALAAEWANCSPTAGHRHLVPE
jgi:hypothetical protein